MDIGIHPIHVGMVVSTLALFVEGVGEWGD